MAPSGNREMFSLGGRGTKQQHQQNVVAVKIIETLLSTPSSTQWARFSKVPKSFRTRKTVAKSQTL